MKKVAEELKKFLERCQKSPHGADAAREKHEAMTERLQNDIKTQLLNRSLIAYIKLKGVDVSY